jgi:hypothetical protein
MDTPPNPNPDLNFEYLMENPGLEILYRMRDARGNLYGVAASRVGYALAHGIVFDSEDEAKLYEREVGPVPMSEERKIALLTAVKESLEYEQRLRDQKATEHGWPIHPNDVEDLTPEQQSAMLEAWCSHLPPSEFLLDEAHPQIKERPMDNDETREVLIAVLELIKSQAVYLRNHQDAFGALCDALTLHDKAIGTLHHTEMLKIRENHVMQSHLSEVDALLKRLEKD